MADQVAKVLDVAIFPDGNTGDVVLAVRFDRKVEIGGAVEFGFVVRHGDVEQMHKQLGNILAKRRIVGLPSRRRMVV